MLKNLEIQILDFLHPIQTEPFNSDFSSVTYYYFYKIRKIKIPGSTYFKIHILNTAEKHFPKYETVSNVLHIRLSHDFSDYISLTENEKELYRIEFLFGLFKTIFTHYGLDVAILDELIKGLQRNNYKMEIIWFKKKFNDSKVQLQIKIEVLKFIFNLQIHNKKGNHNIKLFESIPFFTATYLFTKFKFQDNKLRLGTPTQAIFEIDLENLVSTKLCTSKLMETLEFGSELEIEEDDYTEFDG